MAVEIVKHNFIDWAFKSDPTKINKKQITAHELGKVYDILGYGGAMGGGKSHWLRREALFWVMKFSQQLGTPVPGVIFCEDYPSLQDRQIVKIVEEFPRWLGEYKSGDKVWGHCFKLNPEYGGGVLCLRNLTDVDKYDSSEFAFIGIDQGEKNPVKVFNVLRRRNRWPGIENCKFFVTFNPGGEPWCVQYFVDRSFPPEEKEADKIYYIQALPADNPYLGESYWKKLQSMSEPEQKAYMEGDMHAFEDSMDIQGFLKLLTPQEVNNALVSTPVNTGLIVLGVDPAAGGDESAIVKKSDTQMAVVFNQKLADTMSLVSVIIQAIKTHKAKIVVIDAQGVGAGVYNRLAELKKQNHWAIDVIGVSFGNSAKNKVKFVDIKAEIYWNLREWILKGGKLLRDKGWQELFNIKWKQNSDDKVLIQSKDDLRKQGIRSPNVVDAAVLTMLADPTSYKNSLKVRNGQFNDNTKRYWGD